jgi:hypothetical protein
MATRAIDIGLTFVAHLSGMLFGVATIVGLVPAVTNLMRILTGVM